MAAVIGPSENSKLAGCSGCRQLSCWPSLRAITCLLWRPEAHEAEIVPVQVCSPIDAYVLCCFKRGLVQTGTKSALREANMRLLCSKQCWQRDLLV
jgi:hypothetical protein